MEFTGERFVPSLSGQIKYEHLHRYALSLGLAKGKTVLDIACGEGYGAALLARVAKSVIGVDIEATVIEHARRSYYQRNLKFLAGSCDSIPLPDASVEVVTSFETIEHHDKHEEMMLEIKRVLRPGGSLIISSPNRLTYSDEPHFVNEYHVKELYYDELMELLSGNFSHVRCYGQRIAAGSFVFPLDETDIDQYRGYSGDARTLKKTVCTLPVPIYFIALCSDTPVDYAIDSVYVDGNDDLLTNLEAERLNHIRHLQEEVKEVKKQTESETAQRTAFESQLQEQTAQRTAFESQLQEQTLELTRGREQLATYEVQLSQASEEMAKAQAELEVYSSKLAEREQALAHSQDAVGAIKEELKLVRSTLAAHAQDVQRIEHDYEEKLKWRQSDLQEQKTQLDQQKRELGRREEQLLEYTAQLHQQSKALAAVHGELLGQQATLANEREQKSACERKLEQTELILSTVQSRLIKANEIRTWIHASRGWQLASRLRSLQDFWRETPKLLLGKSRRKLRGCIEIATINSLENGLDVRGWVFSAVAPITRVEGFLDDEYLGMIKYGIARSDIATGYRTKSADDCGFADSLWAASRISSGQTLSVRAFDGAGNTAIYKLPVNHMSQNGDGVAKEKIEAITLRTNHDPELSVVIPVFNQSSFTFNCLNSIGQVLEESPLRVEVVVVDDCSTDDTQAMLRRVNGIRLLNNDKNVGFIDSCNRGAGLARGSYLLFLNNDTIVRRHCFDELVETFRLKTDAGLVGAKLLYGDGRLQEAGGIVWNDASGWNYGRFDDPDKPEYCYLREADYCSGACIAIPKNVFEELGGFDIRYRPAYCEDSDLAFRVREAGYKVYYQPLAEVFHFEGTTSGTDVSENVKHYQVVNQQKLLAKWEKTLSKHGQPDGRIFLSKERQVTKRILVLDACVLTPDQDAGSLTVFNHIKIFQSFGFKVTFAPDNLHRDEKYTAALQRIGVECLYWPYTQSIRSHLEAYGAYYDMVFIARVGVAQAHLADVKTYCRKAKIIFDTEDLHFLREQRRADLEGDPVTAQKALEWKERELSVAAQADCTIVVSPYERDVLLKENPKLNVIVMPVPRDIPGSLKDFNSRKDLLFIGGFQHPPNVDAVLHFVKKIYPLIKLKLPEINFYILGSKPPAEVQTLGSSPGIIVTGYVEDLSPYFNQCRISVAPLRYGAGIKGKILTSLGYGLPVVASPIACEGIGLEHELDVLEAEEPEIFADNVVRLYEDATLWNKLSANGLEKVRRDYSIEAATSVFEHLFSELEKIPGSTNPNPGDRSASFARQVVGGAALVTAEG